MWTLNALMICHEDWFTCQCDDDHFVRKQKLEQASKILNEMFFFYHQNMYKILRYTKEVMTLHWSTHQISIVSTSHVIHSSIKHHLSTHEMSFVHMSNIIGPHVKCHSSTLEMSIVHISNIIRQTIKHPSSTCQMSFVYKSNIIHSPVKSH